MRFQPPLLIMIIILINLNPFICNSLSCNFLKEIIKDFSPLISMKNLTRPLPHRSLTLPLGSMIWTNFEIPYRRMLKHKWQLFFGQFVQEEYLKIFPIYSYKTTAIVVPPYPPWITWINLNLHYLRMCLCNAADRSKDVRAIGRIANTFNAFSNNGIQNCFKFSWFSFYSVFSSVSFVALCFNTCHFIWLFWKIWLNQYCSCR